MGYSTDFMGELKFTTQVTEPQLALIASILQEDCRDHPEWGAEDLTYIDLKFTDNYDGLRWDGSEKTNDLPEKINLLIREVQKQYPEFGLTGTLIAQGEEMDDRWILVMENGIAVQRDIELSGNEVKCPHCGKHFVVGIEK